MKINKLIHIGFGKTGTTKLQKNIFLELANKWSFFYVPEGYKSTDPKVLKIKRELTNHIYKTMLGKKVRKLEIPDNTFITNEELSSYRDANYIDEFAESNLIAFGKDAHILLTIREPRQWLSSVYLQLCMHETPIQRPEDFFLTDENYSERLPNMKFNISKFSYYKTIESYTKRFENVIVVKYESLHSLEFLKFFFSFNESELNDLKRRYGNSIVNRAFSEKAVYLRTKFTKLFNWFGLDHLPKYSNKIMLERASDNYLNNSIQDNQSKKIKIFHYKNIYQKIINNLFKYKKFMIDFDHLDYIPISDLENEYKEIKDLTIYNKN